MVKRNLVDQNYLVRIYWKKCDFFLPIYVLTVKYKLHDPIYHLGKRAVRTV